MEKSPHVSLKIPWLGCGHSSSCVWLRVVLVAGLAGTALGHCPVLWAGHSPAGTHSRATLGWLWDPPQPLDGEESKGWAQTVTSCFFLGRGAKLPGRLSVPVQVQQGVGSLCSGAIRTIYLAVLEGPCPAPCAGTSSCRYGNGWGLERAQHWERRILVLHATSLSEELMADVVVKMFCIFRQPLIKTLCM